MSEWKETTLAEIAEIEMGQSPTGETCNASGDGMPLLNGPTEFGIKNPIAVQYTTDSKRECRPFDILFCVRGSTTGKMNWADRKYSIGRGLAAIRHKSGVEYRYFLQGIIDYNLELLLSSATGSTFPNVTRSQIEGVEIKLPSLPEQKSIASILSSLDDKIDLLHRQNATLEKMAETLFRQWFVEEAKEDWKEGTLDDILTVKGGTTPSTSEPAYWNGAIHWTSPRDITNLNGIYLFDTERKITELGLSKISSGLLPTGTLLMSSRAPVGVLAFCEVPVAINQGYIAILDNKEYSKEFIYLWLKANIDVVHSFSNGSTFMEISKSAFKTLQLQIPPKKVLNNFQLLVKPLFDKIKSNQTQIRTLTALRDTLLPKLMSGEVKVEM